jgi:hypothetical protein
VVIHAGTDDYISDPDGNSGSRIACGVISRGPVTVSRVGRPVEPMSRMLGHQIIVENVVGAAGTTDTRTYLVMAEGQTAMCPIRRHHTADQGLPPAPHAHSRC